VHRACPQPLRPSPSAALRLAASTMAGAKRRAFEAEMTVKYGGGDPRRADTRFGWGRRRVAVGLAESRTGRRGLGAHAAFRGRNRWEDEPPKAAAALRRLAAAPAQQAPTFRTTLASTRRTAQAALAAWRAQGYREDQRPAPATLAEVLNRLGWRWRKVGKAKPQKRMAETDALLAHREKKTGRPRPRQASHACVAMVQPRWRAGTSPAAAARGASTGRVITTWACTSNLCPGGAWLQTVRSGTSPLGALARRALASSRRSRPGGQRARRPSRWP
jgi:hypothetical protein